MTRLLAVDARQRLVKNVLVYPNISPSNSGWSNNGNTAASTNGSNGPRTLSYVAGAGPFGGPVTRMAWTGAGTPGGANVDLLNISATVTAPGNSIGGATIVKPGDQHAISVYVKPSKVVNLHLQSQYLAGSGGGPTTSGTTYTCQPNIWTRMTHVGTAVSPSTGLRFDVDAVNNTFDSGDVIDFANAMLTVGSKIYSYADGNTPGWKWEGTIGASSSVGYLPVTN